MHSARRAWPARCCERKAAACGSACAGRWVSARRGRSAAGSWRSVVSAPVPEDWSAAIIGADAHADWGSQQVAKRAPSARTTLIHNPVACPRVKHAVAFRAARVSVTSPALRRARSCQAPIVRRPRRPEVRSVQQPGSSRRGAHGMPAGLWRRTSSLPGWTRLSRGELPQGLLVRGTRYLWPLIPMCPEGPDGARFLPGSLVAGIRGCGKGAEIPGTVKTVNARANHCWRAGWVVGERPGESTGT